MRQGQWNEPACKTRGDDIWIAAIVVQHDLALLTRDAHFSNLPQLAMA
jgi:predicted nucleic acid-binding protein